MKTKNVEFNLFGTTYNIKYVPKIVVDENTEEEREVYGLTTFSKKEILIAKTINNIPISQEEIRLTLFHEIVHCIFHAGQYLACTNDEPLVEWTSRCLNQLIKDKIL